MLTPSHIVHNKHRAMSMCNNYPAVVDIMNCMPDLRKHAEKEYGGKEFSDLVIRADYQTRGSVVVYSIVLPETVKEPLPPRGTAPGTTIRIIAENKDGNERYCKGMEIGLKPGEQRCMKTAKINREDYGIYRCRKVMKGSNEPLKLIAWDYIDEIWFRALELDGSIWDNIERATTSLDKAFSFSFTKSGKRRHYVKEYHDDG